MLNSPVQRRTLNLFFLLFLLSLLTCKITIVAGTRNLELILFFRKGYVSRGSCSRERLCFLYPECEKHSRTFFKFESLEQDVWLSRTPHRWTPYAWAYLDRQELLQNGRHSPTLTPPFCASVPEQPGIRRRERNFQLGILLLHIRY